MEPMPEESRAENVGNSMQGQNDAELRGRRRSRARGSGGSRTAQIRRERTYSVNDDFPRDALRNTRPRIEPSLSTPLSDGGPQLLEELTRQGITGVGVELLRRREADRDADAFAAFIADRMPIPKHLNKNQKKQAAGKTLKYDKCDTTTRAGLDASRSKEWEKWKHFNAGYIVRGKLLEE